MDEQTTNAPQGSAVPNAAWRRPYCTILAGQAVSQVGSSAVQFALIWYLAQETASPAAMGLAGLAAFLPGALLSPAAGIVADRHNRKRVCIAADLAAGIMATAFALAMGAWGISVAAVIALLAARAAATSFQAPAMQAMVPQIVPAESLVEAGGMSQAISSASYVLGPVVGGLLFAGPSGIGKSTQADLWCRYEKAELLNGDKPVLAKDDTGSWLAYGSPYAGSSRAYVNACVPVRAVIMLKQGGVNEIRRFNTPQAFRHLYENLIVNVWDQGFVQMVCDMLTDLVMKVPVYELVCTPDVRAVQVVKYTLEGGGMNGIGSSKA